MPATCWRSFHVTSGFFFANARKCQNWMVWQRIGVTASTVTVRSPWVIIASSPKWSPGPIVPTRVPSTMTAASPSAITKKSTPLISPCLVSSAPAGTRRSLKSLASWRNWRWLSPLNSGTRFRSSATLGTPRPYLRHAGLWPMHNGVKPLTRAGIGRSRGVRGSEDAMGDHHTYFDTAVEAVRATDRWAVERARRDKASGAAIGQAEGDVAAERPGGRPRPASTMRHGPPAEITRWRQPPSGAGACRPPTRTASSAYHSRYSAANSTSARDSASGLPISSVAAEGHALDLLPAGTRRRAAGPGPARA